MLLAWLLHFPFSFFSIATGESASAPLAFLVIGSLIKDVQISDRQIKTA